MNLSNFLDLGFKITFEEQEQGYHWARVMEEDPVYKQVFEFCKTCDDYKKTEEFLNNLEGKYSLNCRSYSGNTLSRIYLKKQYDTLKVYVIKNEGIVLRLAVDKNTNEVYTIEDGSGYFLSICSHRNLWEKSSLDDDTTAKSCLATVYRWRKDNAEDIRKYYSKEIKKLKNAYKRDYGASQIGLDYLAQFKEG